MAQTKCTGQSSARPNHGDDEKQPFHECQTQATGSHPRTDLPLAQSAAVSALVLHPKPGLSRAGNWARRPQCTEQAALDRQTLLGTGELLPGGSTVSGREPRTDGSGDTRRKEAGARRRQFLLRSLRRVLRDRQRVERIPRLLRPAGHLACPIRRWRGSGSPFLCVLVGRRKAGEEPLRHPSLARQPLPGFRRGGLQVIQARQRFHRLLKEQAAPRLAKAAAQGPPLSRFTLITGFQTCTLKRSELRLWLSLMRMGRTPPRPANKII